MFGKGVVEDVVGKVKFLCQEPFRLSEPHGCFEGCRVGVVS